MSFNQSHAKTLLKQKLVSNLTYIHTDTLILYIYTNTYLNQVICVLHLTRMHAHTHTQAIFIFSLEVNSLFITLYYLNKKKKQILK